MVTHLLYLDEQEGTINNESFTAIIGFRIIAEDINRVRATFYPKLNEIINRHLKGDIPSSPKQINSLPLLHGCDFLREYSDEVKFEVLDVLSDCLKEVDFNLLRVGYFNRSISAEMMSGSRIDRLNLCLTGIGFAIWDKQYDNHILISEIDKEALKKNLESNFNNVGSYFAMGPMESSQNLSRIVGHFYAPKADLGCQIADILNYACLKFTSGNSNFSSRFARFYDKFAHRYLVNQVIWLNNSSRNFNLPQSNPLAGLGIHFRTNPLTNVFRVIPNDDHLDAVAIPPVE